MELSTGLVIFFALLIGHTLADYPLQGDYLARAKNRHFDATALFERKKVPTGLWIHALTAHSLIHAGAVWWITGSAILAAIELVLHWCIDFAKCEGWTSFNTDQLLHIACKAGYTVLIMGGMVAARPTCFPW
jgi:hypothetical protein